MKFLVTLRRRDGVPIPPELLAGMLLAQRDWVREKISDGTFDCGYAFAQSGGGIAIVNADSGEELSELVAEAPVFAAVNIEVQPLADMSALENAAQALERMATAPA